MGRTKIQKDIKSWEDISAEWTKMQGMSCKPDFCKLRVGQIIDEEKSVRWNREQVEENHNKYYEEVKRLNQEKNLARQLLLENIYDKVQYEIGHNINRDKAKAVWNFAYEYSGTPTKYISDYLEELIDLIKAILV